MFSTISFISLGGLLVMLETEKAIVKFINIPTKPIPSGEIPNNQFSEKFKEVFINLK